MIAVERNGTGRYDFRRVVGAEVLQEKLRNKPTIDGSMRATAAQPGQINDRLITGS